MYFTDMRRLRRELVRGELDPGDGAIYVFLMFGLAVPLWYPQPIDPTFTALPTSGVLLGFINLGIAAVGVWYCYRANGGSTGVRFAETFTAVAWVASVRLLLGLVLPLLVALYVVVTFAPSQLKIPAPLAIPVFGPITQALLLWRTSAHIAVVQKRRARAA